MRDLQADLGLTYLFITHDLAFVEVIATLVMVLRHGRVVETGTVDQIFDAPQEDYTRELLAAIQRMESAIDASPEAAG